MNSWIRGKDLLVAVCDADILGKTFREGRLKIEVKESFYGGKLVSLEEALAALKEASIGNIVGKEIVKSAIEEGIIHKDAVIWIGGQPHAQFIKMFYW
ncbi:MAG: DUF424 domain-containing protein [Candidatus Methanomethylicota archaeon]|uniref:DUF424 domain-containing protein n=1 Tax=Thermoproteota archaeon TaxID=2056631 RepID=A0A497EWQ7_9CREN|nr:MAG: DUF424 domain-containing protein [Candidatus Verstraetearchaeota archaeon]